MMTQNLTAAITAIAMMSVGMAQENSDTVIRTAVIDGATEPEKIPKRTKYAMFVKRYSIDIRDTLVQKISRQDDAILNSLSVEDEAAERIENERFKADFLDLCARRQGKEPVRLAKENHRIINRHHDTRVKRYLAELDKLSNDGRAVVEDFIAHVIVPNTRAEEFDYVSWASNNPADYMSHFDLSCQVVETGEYPPEVRKAIDEKVRELNQARQAELRSLFGSSSEPRE